MAIYFNDPRPTLTFNDDTGEFVLTANIVAVIDTDEGSRIRLINDGFVESPLSPEELHSRLYDLEID